MEEYLADQLPSRALAELLRLEPRVQLPRRRDAGDARAADRRQGLGARAGRPPHAGRRRPTTSSILDAPATGHGVAVLERAARRSPRPRAWAASPARAVRSTRCVCDPERTGVVAVARPEEMPVNETLALAATRCATTLGLERRRSSSPTALLPDRFSAADVRGARGRAATARRSRAALAAPTRAPAPSARSCARLRRGRARAGRRRCRSSSTRRSTAGARRALARDAGARAVSGERLAGKRVVICAGSGGVGKTTTSAALAMGLAAEGARVAVVTIDPARRLANALGLDELGNEPRLVDPERFAGHGIEMQRRAVGDDARRQAHVRRAHRAARARRARRATRSSPTASTSSSRARSRARRSSPRSPSSTSSTASGRFDVLVLDTPPSRNALDFLDAPDRLTGFLEGRALQRLPRPDRASRRGSSAAGRASSSRVLQAPHRRRPARRPQRLLPRARRPHRRLQASAPRASRRCSPTRRRRSSSSPRPSASRSRRRSSSRGKLREARHAVRRPDRQPRARRSTAAPAEPTRRRRALAAELGDASSRRRSRAPTPRSARSPSATTPRSSTCARRPASSDPVVVPQLDGDVHDVDGLVAVHAHLFAD